MSVPTYLLFSVAESSPVYCCLVDQLNESQKKKNLHKSTMEQLKSQEWKIVEDLFVLSPFSGRIKMRVDL